MTPMVTNYLLRLFVIIAQIKGEEEVIEEGQDEFQQIISAAEAASELIATVRWLETQASDSV